MLTPRSSAVPAAAVLPPAPPRPYAAAFRGLIALAAATGLVIECVHGNVLVVLSFFTIWSNVLVAVVLGAAFYLLGLAIVGLDRIRPAPPSPEYRISSERARGLK